MLGHALETPEPKNFSKPAEIDELIDQYWHRPIAKQLVNVLQHTPVTPNQVTIAAGILGACAGLTLLFAAATPMNRLFAALLLFVSVVFDCADGQLARAKKISSTTGAILDGVSDYVVGIFMFVGVISAAAHDLQHGAVWLLGVFAGLSTVAQCALYDNSKNRYVHRVGLAYHEREEDLAKISEDKQRARAAGQWTQVFLFWIYEKYSLAQRAAMKANPVATDPQGYRQRNRLRMRLWTTIGIGTHFCCMYLGLLFSMWWPSALFACLLLFATLMNMILIALFVTEPRE
jgi:phosphatidylglycerophosphate synthase